MLKSIEEKRVIYGVKGGREVKKSRIETLSSSEVVSKSLRTLRRAISVL